MSEWIDAAGVALRVRRDGEGPVQVVLLHEMGSLLENWDRVVAALLTAEPSLGIVRFDQRGHGLSEKLHTTPALGDLAADLAAVIGQAADPSRPPLLVGCALGAAVALHLGATRPELARGILALSPPVPSMEGKRPGGESDLDAAAALIADEGMRERTLPRIERYFHADFRDDPAFFEQYCRRMMAMDGVSYIALNRLMQGMDLGPDLEAIRLPVRLVQGLRDKVRPLSDVEAAARRLANGSFGTVDSGHFMTALTPQAVADEIVAMLRRTQGN